MPTDPIAAYLQKVEAARALGNASEHTYRPALKALLEALQPTLTATNEPKRIACGAPDFTLSGPTGAIIGYVEAKDLDVPLEAIERDSERATPQTDNGRQLKRYRAALPNLLLTDYLEWRLFTNGERHHDPARLARTGPHNTLVREKDAGPARALLHDFLSHQPQGVNNPRELAERLARLTHLIRDIIVAAFARDVASTTLRDLYKAFREQLIADLDTDEFADMFAQTLAYGLFAARANHSGPGSFSRESAAKEIPKTNPFLRRLFKLVTDELEDEPYAGLVDDLTQLLALTDMGAVLADFGRRTRQQDPVVHFYETFLAAYDPKLREARGVYYTPEPVVSYLVRSVDYLLKKRFKCTDGLADTSTIPGSHREPDGKPDHRVLVLDPACGTGSFLYAIMDHIRQAKIAAGDAGDWAGYVHDHLLPRLFGFELLMAPYAAAHLKLGLQLAGKDLPDDLRQYWSYGFQGDERLGVYLTNTLEEAHKRSELLFGQWIADEANAAAAVKRDRPIMVVIGNPPYSGHSANKGEWIRDLVEDYKRDCPELYKPAQAKWLQNDYVKFIRFGQWRIEQSGSGILAFITDNSYLANPTFRCMRAHLMQTFTDIYILNLHGNSNKRERSPDGGTDENVFDIRQGVAIGIFIRDPNKHDSVTVYYADLWGERESNAEVGKYSWLFSHDLSDTPWTVLTPDAPYYLFVKQSTDLRSEYYEGWKLSEAMNVNGDPAPGIVTTQDEFAISWTPEEAVDKVERFLATKSEQEARGLFRLCSQSQWNYSKAKMELAAGAWKHQIYPLLYRPFDMRWTVYNSNVAVHRRERVMSHMLAGANLGISTSRAIEIQTGWEHIFCTSTLIQHHSVSIKEVNYLFPLYLYPEQPGQQYQRSDAIEAATKAIRTGGQVPANQVAAEVERVTALIKRLFPAAEYPRWPNFAPDFLAAVEDRLGLGFVPAGRGDLAQTFGPEDLFHYAYAVFHAPSYRQRYAEFLKIDFPRLPLTGDPALFRTLAGLGAELVDRHLLRTLAPAADLAHYPVPGSDQVDPGYPKYSAGRVYINAAQYFEGVPEAVWAFPIGGYQVAEKWLKDRKGRVLTYDERQHYRQTLAALAATIRLMAAIEAAIPAWPLP